VHPEGARAGPAEAGTGPQIESLGSGLDFPTTSINDSAQGIVLHDYQLAAVARVRAAYALGRRRVLFVMATGSGKTIVFVYIISSAVAREKRVLILVHRVELIDHVAAELESAGVAFGIIAPGFAETEAPVQIASVASMARPKRLNRWRNRFHLIVVDEAHHAVAGSWTTVLTSQPGAKILGVTATPERLDGRGLVEVFDELIEGPSTSTLIEGEWLSPFACFEPAVAPDLSRARIRAGDYAIEDIRGAVDGVVIQSVVDEYLKRCPGVPAVAFCCDVAHSQAVAERFRTAGVRAVHVDGETPVRERLSAIAGLGNGTLEVICNCGLISEGVDVPAIGAVLMLRPTASLALYLQMIGRALRPSAKKGRALILDFAGNVSRHGLPDAPRTWSLNAKPRRQREKSDRPRLPKCSSCSALNHAGAHRCAACGADLKTPRQRREIELRLEQARRRETEDMLARMTKRERWTWAGADEQRLREVARVSGYRPGWVHFRIQELRAVGTRP
jgi:DNA repair protein RadD